MRSLLLVVLLCHGAAADPAPERGTSLFDAYLVTLAATSGPVLAGMAISGEQDHGWRANMGGVIATAGLLLGPSAGHWYAGEGFTTGLALRLGGAAGLVTLAVADPHAESGMTWLGIGAAIGMWETGFLWDVVTLPRAVRRTHVVPVVTANGIALAGRF
jgi:hypothetical protein